MSLQHVITELQGIENAVRAMQRVGEAEGFDLVLHLLTDRIQQLSIQQLSKQVEKKK